MLKTRHILASTALTFTVLASAAFAGPSVMDAMSYTQAQKQSARAAAYKDGQINASLKTVEMTSDYLAQTEGSDAELLRDHASTQAFTRVNAVHHKAARFVAKEQECLATAIYYEARSETRSGQMAVAEVLQNRVKSKHYPNSICGVVYQGSGRKTGCQFSFTCDGSIKSARMPKSWDKAVEMADYIFTHQPEPITRGATHYHTTAINPKWSTDLRFTRQIGSHRFYRFKFKERPSIGAPSLAVAPPI